MIPVAFAPLREKKTSPRFGVHGGALETFVMSSVSALAFLAAFLAGPSVTAVDGTTVTTVRSAHAEPTTIKHPGDHPDYLFEAEPHALVGFGGPFKDRGGAHIGAGFRGTFVVLGNGFIKTINNSVGISFGADIFGENTLFLPVAMQWNFWLSRHWSVFGEPGIGLAFKDFESKKEVLHPILMAGGRYHFSDTVALTLRVGYPAVAIGVSFLF